jgi:methylsterol monooxygenase
LQRQIVYFGRAIPWIIIDAIPYFRKWKLQPGKVPSPQEQWECTKQVLFSHFTIELPAVRIGGATFLHLNQCLPRSGSSTPWQRLSECPRTRSPSLHGEQCFLSLRSSSFLKTCSITLVRIATNVPTESDDTYMPAIIAHQALHTGVLYKHIHKIHHKYSAPFGLAAEYAHPAEVFILGTGTILGPLLYCYFMRDLHICNVYLWITLRLFQAIDAHSGYGAWTSSPLI